MTHVITPEEVTTLYRFCDVDSEDMERIIADVENLDIKPQIGSELLIDLMDKPAAHPLLLDGGRYESCGKTYLFGGLKKVVACYAYARAVQASSVRLTRTGLTSKYDDTSNAVDQKGRADVCRAAQADGDKYLAEVLKFLDNTGYSLYTGGRKVKQTRMKSFVIGK